MEWMIGQITDSGKCSEEGPLVKQVYVTGCSVWPLLKLLPGQLALASGPEWLELIVTILLLYGSVCVCLTKLIVNFH